MRRLTLTLLLLTTAAAEPAAAQSVWTIAPPDSVVPLGKFADTTLTESSAAAASRAQPGVIWTLNDSGNPPWIYAIDTAGNTLATFRVTGARNFDWEELTLSPCPAGTCVVIGDIGDNPETRPSVMLYRIPEPTVTAAERGGITPTAPADTLALRYPDGPHDIEAMYADSAGTLYFISKGRSKGILLFRLPASAWSAGGSAMPELIDSLPIRPDISIGQWVTDAALAPDGRRVAVRTYSAIFFFAVRPDGRLTPDHGQECFFGQLEPQGEGVTWLDERRLLLTSESSSTSRGTLFLLDCGPHP
jgi:hypothetical protein